MFSGLVSGTGKIKKINKDDETIVMTIHPEKSQFLDGVQVGDSIAIDGTCLTVETFQEQEFTVTLMPQTFEKTTFKDREIGDLVNLERS